MVLWLTLTYSGGSGVELSIVKLVFSGALKMGTRIQMGMKQNGGSANTL